MNCVISIESFTSGEAMTPSPKQGRPNFSADGQQPWPRRCPRMIEPRTRRACRAAVTSRPKKKTIRSGEAKLRIELPAGRRVVQQQSGAVHADQHDEQPDADGDAVAHAGADGLHQFLAHAEHREQQEHHARVEHHAQADLPGRWSSRRRFVRRATWSAIIVAGGRQQRADEEEVFAHAGRLGDGVAAVEAHDGRGQGGRDAGGGGDGPEVHARRMPNIRPESTIGWTTMI